MLFFKDEYIDSFPLEDRCIPAEKSNFLWMFTNYGLIGENVEILCFGGA